MKNIVNSIKYLILNLWDPTYTKLTPREGEELKRIMREMDQGEYVTDKDIEW